MEPAGRRGVAADAPRWELAGLTPLPVLVGMLKLVVVTALAAVLVVWVPMCVRMAPRPQVQGTQGGLRRKVGLHALLQVGLGAGEVSGGEGRAEGSLAKQAIQADASRGKEGWQNVS